MNKDIGVYYLIMINAIAIVGLLGVFCLLGAIANIQPTTTQTTFLKR